MKLYKITQWWEMAFDARCHARRWYQRTRRCAALCPPVRARPCRPDALHRALRALRTLCLHVWEVDWVLPALESGIVTGSGANPMGLYEN